jgi:citronellol/citronellal dehydrogenase
MLRRCRKPEIMADAAHAIVTRGSRACTGNFFIDDDVLREAGVSDLSPYRHPGVGEDELMPDFFL